MKARKFWILGWAMEFCRDLVTPYVHKTDSTVIKELE